MAACSSRAVRRIIGSDKSAGVVVLMRRQLQVRHIVIIKCAPKLVVGRGLCVRVLRGGDVDVLFLRGSFLLAHTLRPLHLFMMTWYELSFGGPASAL